MIIYLGVMYEYNKPKITSVDKEIYQQSLQAIFNIIKINKNKATIMYFDPWKKKQEIGWHLLLSKHEGFADYFVVYKTDLISSVAQIRFLRGEYQLQYTLEPNNVILLSQFRIFENDEFEQDYEPEATKDAVLTINQPISNAEAKGVLDRLKRHQNI